MRPAGTVATGSASRLMVSPVVGVLGLLTLSTLIIPGIGLRLPLT